MESGTYRPLTPEERKQIEDILRLIRSSTSFQEIAIGGCLNVGCIMLLTTILGLGALSLFGPGEEARAVALDVALVGLLLLGPLAWLIGSIAIYAKRKRKASLEISNLAADLADGKAHLSQYSAADAMEAILAEHRERCFFIRLEDGRVMFLGPWAPYENDNPAGIEGSAPQVDSMPSTEFEVARAPSSGLYLGSRGTGDPLDVSASFVLRANEPDWMTFVQEPWDEIVGRYGSA